MSRVYRHVILFRWLPDATPEQVAAAHEHLATLPEHLPQIRRYSAGPDVGRQDHNADYALLADFDDEAAYRSYRDDPYHLEVIDRYMKPIIESYVRVQYQAGSP